MSCGRFDVSTAALRKEDCRNANSVSTAEFPGLHGLNMPFTTECAPLVMLLFCIPTENYLDRSVTVHNFRTVG
jgi:hypothetical protein